MSPELSELIDKARRAEEMTPEDAENQIRSFAYGNTKIENDSITREMVEAAAEALSRGR